MAADNPLKELWAETTCPICLEYFRDPVILDCGHNFCQACLTQYCQELKTEPTCLNCREILQIKENFRPNRQLANMIEIIKKLEVDKKEDRKRGVCQKHQGPLKLFCKDDETLICLVCDKSQAHVDHQVVPAEEPAQEYKEKLQAQLKSLEKEKENLVNQQQSEELLSQNWLKQLRKEKQVAKHSFEKICTFLKEKEQLRMIQLDSLEKEIEKKRGENITRLSVEISCLSNLMAEMEQKYQQPESEFLQDIRSMFKGCEKEKVDHVLHQSPWLEERLRLSSQKTSVLEDAVKKCTEILEQAMVTESLEHAWHQDTQCRGGTNLRRKIIPEARSHRREGLNVMLDPQTAHPDLILSEDLKGVEWKGLGLNLPDNPERFDKMWAVLGHERFTSGKQCWEVEIEGRIWETWSTMTALKALWTVGVARESVVRKGEIYQYPSQGIWAVGKATHETFSSCQFWACTSPGWTPLVIRNEIRKIRIFLDYDEGLIEFFDADTDCLIFVFTSGSFGGEAIRPYFWLNSGVRMRC